MLPRMFGGSDAGNGERWLVIALFLYVLLVSVWPLGQVFLTAFQPGDDGRPLGLMADTLTARATGRALKNTLVVSLGSVAISVGLGVALALTVGLLRMRARAALTFLILMPLIIPSQTMALSWIELFGSNSPVLRPLGLAPQGANPIYSSGGIALVMGIEHMPLVFIAIRAALSGLPADLVEAARIAAIPYPRILRSIILPILAPSILAGGLLAFTAAVGNFGVPALLGIPARVPVLTTLIYQRLNGFGPEAAGQVAVLAILLTLIAVAALLLRSLLTRQLRMPMSGSGRAFVAEHAAPGWAQVTIWAVVLMIAVLPLAALTMTSFLPAVGVAFSATNVSLAQYQAVLGNDAVLRAFANSLWLSGLCAAICVLVAVPYAYLAAHRPGPLLAAIDLMVEAPWVVPGTVVALAMILAFLQPIMGVSIYGTAAIIVLAYLARFLPLVLRPVTAAAQLHDPAQDEAARIIGAGLLRRLGQIFAPAVIASTVGGAILIMMTAMNELTLSALLWSTGNETIGVMVFSLQYEGNSTAAAAVSVLSTLLLFAICGLAQLLSRHLPGNALPWQNG
ncbi:iron(III) transport system permease protein [Paracoccus laeviglucosivorans]|uniref:Iron(III) transport system permease protein n=2 Tax=Paracoccus laeviglucosivorans TaxID=1197861 RepID=A0A521BD20_9RHOB|nr:iron(III) transport system permease protein [Paracoccus laeviglucosivorans]